jgi:hypothetical protein
MKKYLLGSLAVFITYAVLDFIVHAVLLMGTYQATASLWRPQGEMNMGLMYLVTAVTALTFTAIYAFHVRGASVSAGVKYGLLYGVGGGFAWAFGTYAMMPIPMNLAWAWFVSFVVETAVAGAVAGWIVKPQA